MFYVVVEDNKGNRVEDVTFGDEVDLSMKELEQMIHSVGLTAIEIGWRE
jgi:hypothetical protein